MKKKLLALSLAAVMVLSMSGCSSRNIKLNQRTKTFDVTETTKTVAASTSSSSATAIKEVNIETLTFSAVSLI